MSETKFVSETRHERLSEKVSRLQKDLSDVQRKIIRIEQFVSLEIPVEEPVQEKSKVKLIQQYSLSEK